MAPCSSVEVRVPGCDEPFAVGTEVRPLFHLVDAAGEPADATVAASMKLPDGSVIVPDVVRDSIGEYHFVYVPGVGGQYRFRFEATGALFVASSGAFLVAASPV